MRRIDFQEDRFDLEAFQQDAAQRRILRYRQKYQKLARLIVFVAVLVMVGVGFLLLMFINMSIEQWRIQQRQNNIVALTQKINF